MRRGVTILEVLFSILIAVIGLLGAISVFVVASAQYRKASVLQAASNDGRSAVAMFDTAGMRNHAQWRIWNSAANPPQFQQPFPPPTPVTAGVSICIDSRFVAANTGGLPQAGSFPFEWTDPTNAAVSNPAGPRMFRVGFFGPPPWDAAGNIQPITQTLARLMGDHFFVLNDDLNIERPKDGSLPGAGTWDAMPSGAPGKRQTNGEFSWLATLVPRDFLSDQYILSVVIFNQRPAGFAIKTPAGTFDPLAGEHERVVALTWPPPADGTTGGEVILSAPTEARLKLRSGDWVMLSGRVGLLNHFAWYRVSDVDDATQNSTGWERYVTLIGQDWPAADAAMQQAVIVEGVINVVERTVRLEVDGP